MFNEIEEFKEILDNEKFKSLDKYIAHGRTSIMKHSILVAELGLKMIDKFKLKVNKAEFIKSALLHDFYFYDWRKAPKYIGLHGFSHPRIAADNAKATFGTNDREYANILSHMWPLTIRKLPKTGEGVLLCIADKICTVREVLGMCPKCEKNNEVCHHYFCCN